MVCPMSGQWVANGLANGLAKFCKLPGQRFHQWFGEWHSKNVFLNTKIHISNVFSNGQAFKVHDLTYSPTILCRTITLKLLATTYLKNSAFGDPSTPSSGLECNQAPTVPSKATSAKTFHRFGSSCGLGTCSCHASSNMPQSIFLHMACRPAKW